MAGDARGFEHRAVRVTAAQQGPVGDHQVHLHRLKLTHLPPGQQPQRGVRGDRTHPPTLRALRRLGIADESTDIPTLRGMLERAVPKNRGAEFSDLIEELAHDTCVEGEPDCPACELRKICPTGLARKAEAAASAKSSKAAAKGKAGKAKTSD